MSASERKKQKENNTLEKKTLPKISCCFNQKHDIRGENEIYKIFNTLRRCRVISSGKML